MLVEIVADIHADVDPKILNHQNLLVRKIDILDCDIFDDGWTERTGLHRSCHIFHKLSAVSLHLSQLLYIALSAL